MTRRRYIDAADDMLPQVQSAYARVASKARRALSNALVASSDWDGSYFSIPGHANGTSNAPPGWAWVGEEGPELMRMRGGEQILPNSVSQQVAEDYSEYQRYAAQDVQPELSDGVSQERAAAESYSTYSRYAAVQGVQQARPLEVVRTGSTASGIGTMELHFHIEAGATPETVDAWQDYARRGELKAVVLEVMEDADVEARRRTLA